MNTQTFEQNSIGENLLGDKKNFLKEGTLVDVLMMGDRVIDVFPAEQQDQVRAQFAESIQAIISQVLLKRKNDRGLVPALEVMIGTPAVRNLIREGKIAQRKFGGHTRDYGQ
jgi:hypothetical protein